MCKDRKKFRTNMRDPDIENSPITERGWCEEVAPGLYRSLVHHLEPVPCMILDESILEKFPDAKLDECEYRALPWGTLFQGREAPDGGIDPEVTVGRDLTSCDDADDSDEL